GSYANASLLGRIVTIFSGPLANYMFASVLFFVSLYFGGKPPADVTTMPSQVMVIEGGPAERAQIQNRDRIVEVAGVPVETWLRMKQEISKHPSEPITIVIERDGARIPVAITPDKNDAGEGQIWVQPPRVPVSGPGEAAVLA